MNLAIDIGNTFIKAGLFQDKKLIKCVRTQGMNYQRLLSFALHNDVRNIIVSSVRNNHPFNSSRFKRNFHCVTELNAQLPLPIKNKYKTPETLGRDRLAAAVGANTIFPSENVLFIDMGSAVTIDFINKEAEYFGGNISPGMNMRYKALNAFTNQLPLVRRKSKHITLGKTTEEAIQGGVENGLIFELEGYIEFFRQKYPDLKTILTGGDAKFFDNKLKYPIFAEPNLTLKGLNKILKHNIYEA
jgi:type III pantothenate kinase